MNLSVSQYLLGGKHVGDGQLDRIESMLSQLICGFGDTPIVEPPRKEVAPKLEGDAKEVLDKLESAKQEIDLEAANAKLMENRKKIADLKNAGMKSASDIPFRSFPKKGGK